MALLVAVIAITAHIQLLAHGVVIERDISSVVPVEISGTIIDTPNEIEPFFPRRNILNILRDIWLIESHAVRIVYSGENEDARFPRKAMATGAFRNNRNVARLDAYLLNLPEFPFQQYTNISRDGFAAIRIMPIKSNECFFVRLINWFCEPFLSCWANPRPVSLILLDGYKRKSSSKTHEKKVPTFLCSIWIYPIPEVADSLNEMVHLIILLIAVFIARVGIRLVSDGYGFGVWLTLPFFVYLIFFFDLLSLPMRQYNNAASH
jgi:hypothetical protein